MKKYFLDILNWFDALIVILSTIELILNPDFTPNVDDDNNLSAFKSLRIMRTFRVLRVAKLMRHLKYMKMIISVIAVNINTFAFLALLLLIVLLIYTLFGIILYSNKFDKFEERFNFDSFLHSIWLVFQVFLTLLKYFIIFLVINTWKLKLNNVLLLPYWYK